MVSGENWVAVYGCGEAMALTVLQEPQPAGLAMVENWRSPRGCNFKKRSVSPAGHVANRVPGW